VEVLYRAPPDCSHRRQIEAVDDRRNQIGRLALRDNVATSAERRYIAEGVDYCREALALLTATAASVTRIQDADVRQLALASLEAVSHLEARLRLLDEAYRIAERHRAALTLGETATLEMEEPATA